MLKKKLLIVLSILFINSNLNCATGESCDQDVSWDDLLTALDGLSITDSHRSFSNRYSTDVTDKDLESVGHHYECPTCKFEIGVDLSSLCKAKCQAMDTKSPHIFHKHCFLNDVARKEVLVKVVDDSADSTHDFVKCSMCLKEEKPLDKK